MQYIGGNNSHKNGSLESYLYEFLVILITVKRHPQILVSLFCVVFR